MRTAGREAATSGVSDREEESQSQNLSKLSPSRSLTPDAARLRRAAVLALR